MNPQELRARLHEALEDHHDDPSSPLLEPVAWADEPRAARRTATGWHTGAEGLNHFDEELSDRLRRAFYTWAETPGSTLPEGRK